VTRRERRIDANLTRRREARDRLDLDPEARDHLRKAHEALDILAIRKNSA
jgi:hypothetical protein